MSDIYSINLIMNLINVISFQLENVINAMASARDAVVKDIAAFNEVAFI